MENGIETIFSVLRGTKILFLALISTLVGVFLIVKSDGPIFSGSGFIFIVIGVTIMIINFKLRVSKIVRRVKTDYKD
ncbi:hypothetical protein HN604_00875 [archaeon]|jgi:hypothetical protein|nr:hypothetical protein [archaeon]MBT6182709.1 hypothetical protein [archaeon]MBT6606694.1 hypothetical protein [archaeon]MBT7251937.1 hypothetical protein [archaeon]MBT7660616.1 hypothetical protein [archaeon]